MVDSANQIRGGETPLLVDFCYRRFSSIIVDYKSLETI